MSKTTFELGGLNFENLMRELSQKGIEVVFAKRLSPQKFTLSVDTKYKVECLALFKQKCYTVFVVEDSFFGSAKDFFTRHVAIVAAFVIIVSAMALLPCFYLNVETNLPDVAEAESLIEQCGVSKWCPMSKIDVNLLGAKLCVLTDAAYCLVSKDGCALKVEVVYKTEVDALVDFTARRDVTALRDGVVTRVVLLRGTACVAVGDSVSKGQVLVAGKRTYFDGVEQDVFALADVYALVSAVGEASFVKQTTVLVDSGKTFQKTVLTVFGSECPSEQVPFAFYRIEEEECVLQPLNVSAKRVTFFEQLQTTVSLTRDNYLSAAMETAAQIALNQLGCAAQYVQYVVTDEGVTATAFAEMKIT